MIKFDTSGGIIWKKSLDGIAIFNSVAIDSSGNCVVVGSSDTNSIDGALILKLDSNGELIWKETLSGGE